LTSGVTSTLGTVGKLCAPRTLHYLNIPFVRTNFAKRAYLCTALFLWNSLPTSLTQSTSLSSFKANLNTCFFRQAYLQ